MSDENQPISEEATPADDPVDEVKVEEPVVEATPEVAPEPEPEPEIPLEPADPQVDPASNDTGLSEPETVSGPVSESAPEPETPQIPVNEPFTEPAPVTETKADKPDEPRFSYLKLQKWGELLVVARDVLQFRKRKKLDKIMTLFEKKREVVNDDVEKLLHVSDATATRYLSQLEKDGRIKQHGTTGRGVSYSRV